MCNGNGHWDQPESLSELSSQLCCGFDDFTQHSFKNAPDQIKIPNRPTYVHLEAR